MAWQNTQGTGAKRYTCGWCGERVASISGYNHSKGAEHRIQVCPNCGRPTYFSGDAQHPGISPGDEVVHLPPDIAALYKEARNCSAANCFTASVLISRKLLMNIAVAQGAAPGLAFIAYVEHLANSGYVPPNGKGWVDHIRRKGNEATHEIALMTKVDAEELLAFIEMLLKFIFEFPSRVPKTTG